MASTTVGHKENVESRYGGKRGGLKLREPIIGAAQHLQSTVTRVGFQFSDALLEEKRLGKIPGSDGFEVCHYRL